MREATIGGLSAFDAVRPRKGAGGKGRPGSAKRPAGWGPRFRRFRARAALIVGSAGLSALMIGIILNATVMQKGHHPAPLFATATAPAPVPVPALVPRPADPPAQALPSPSPAVPTAPPAEAIATAMQAPQAVPSAPPSKPAHTGAPAHRAKAEDGIARLLARGDAAHAPAAHGPSGVAATGHAAHHAGAPTTPKTGSQATRPGSSAGRAVPVAQ